MKRILKITAVVFAIVLGSALQNKASAQYSPNDDVSYQNFYDELSPYGDWIEYPDYGYVWQPRMGDDFRPYSSGGQWVWNDDYEWMWVSDYDWGWAPFHYGRWFEDDYYGWLWQPGYEWSPAWVAWRDGGDNYGWAPLRPGISISIGFNIGSYNPPYNYWNFAPRRYITSHNINSYCLPWRQNVTYINQTVIINNFNYGNSYGFRTGPRRYEAERYCGAITSVSFRNSYRPGRTQFRNNEVNIYRPNIRRDEGRNYSPRQFNRYDRQGNGSRMERNDNGFRRDDNNRGNNNGNIRGNNFPDRNQRNSNTPNESPRFDRNNNNGQQPNRNNEVRTPRQIERPADNNNNGNGSMDRRRFDRNGNNGQQPNRNNDTRSPQQMERRDINQGNNNRQFERRTNNGNSNETVRQPGNEMRRNENRNQPQPQRQYSPQPEQRRVQEQPRQPERREGNQQTGRNESNNGNRGGNGKRF